VAALGAAVPASAATAPGMRCAEPTGYADLPSRSAAASGLDAGKLRYVVRQAATSVGGSVAVYRYGCKVEEAYSGGDAMSSYQSWSAAKSIVSTAAGRAMQLGLLSPGDTVGSLIPEADRAHGAITVQQLLTQSSGLHQHTLRDYNFVADDHLANALTLPFDHAPGTTFTYGQVTVSLLAEMVGRAAGGDFQDFVRRELLAPLGIPAREFRISRDVAGRTNGYFGIESPIRFWARIGQLWLQDGIWDGRRLLDADWMRGVRSSSPTNPCYSYLSWVDAPGCEGRWAPPDGFRMSGLGDQTVWVVPSQSLVVVRFGPMTTGVTSALRRGVTESIRLPRPVPRRPVEPERGQEATTGLEAGPGGLLNLEDLLATVQVGRKPLPTAGPPRTRAAVVPARRLTVRRDRDLELPVACPPVAPMPCAGRVAVLERAGGPRLTSASFLLAPGTRGLVRVGSAALDRALGTTARTVLVRATTTDGLEGATTDRAVRVEPPPRARKPRRSRKARKAAKRPRAGAARPAGRRAT